MCQCSLIIPIQGAYLCLCLLNVLKTGLQVFKISSQSDRSSFWICSVTVTNLYFVKNDFFIVFNYVPSLTI